MVYGNRIVNFESHIVQGTKVHCEDVVGNVGNTFWVIDGATDLSDPGQYRRDTVASFVSLVNAALHDTVSRRPELDLRVVMGEAVSKARKMAVDLWRWTNDDDFHDPWSEPTFAFLIARVDGNVVEYVQAADVSFIVTSEDGTVFHEAVDDVFAKHAAESAEKIAGLDKSSPTFYEDKVDIYREIRSRANRGDTYPRGYLIGAWDGNQFESMTMHTLNLKPGKRYEFLVHSDGYPAYKSGKTENGRDDASWIRFNYRALEPGIPPEYDTDH